MRKTLITLIWAAFFIFIAPSFVYAHGSNNGNGYQAFRADPWNNKDPMGLYDPDDPMYKNSVSCADKGPKIKIATNQSLNHPVLGGYKSLIPKKHCPGTWILEKVAWYASSMYASKVHLDKFGKPEFIAPENLKVASQYTDILNYCRYSYYALWKCDDGSKSFNHVRMKTTILKGQCKNYN